ncbi:MAG: hypothetical protein BM485_07220 [Desulfobulbaceae bacterium DB1]|nr:MAG: hypothetical protein BM485_07220 [Desulfobulbaceae bacterium DB1]
MAGVNLEDNAKQGPAPPGKPLVLIVDDHPVNVRMLVEALGDLYRLKIATDGRIALNVIAMDERPDLVLLDIVMPEVDGYEVCARLKEDPATALIPVIFITSLGQVSEESRGLALGASDYISKPFNMDVVRLRVANHLAMKRQRDLLQQQKEKLEEALERVKLLSGLLPICASCKKIRDDKGYWKQIESYIRDHSEARFSHGICPECLKRFYPDIAEDVLAEMGKEVKK